MPIVEITDKAGKKYRVEFDKTPTDADIDSAVKSLNSGRGAFSVSKASGTGKSRTATTSQSSDPFSSALRKQGIGVAGVDAIRLKRALDPQGILNPGRVLPG